MERCGRVDAGSLSLADEASYPAAVAADLVGPKGRGDCGNHEWYKSTDAEDHCYHCAAGFRIPSRFDRS